MKHFGFVTKSCIDMAVNIAEDFFKVYWKTPHTVSELKNNAHGERTIPDVGSTSIALSLPLYTIEGHEWVAVGYEAGTDVLLGFDEESSTIRRIPCPKEYVRECPSFKEIFSIELVSFNPGHVVVLRPISSSVAVVDRQAYYTIMVSQDFELEFPLTFLVDMDGETEVDVDEAFKAYFRGMQWDMPTLQDIEAILLPDQSIVPDGCPICLDWTCMDRRSLGCLHTFCRECITQWLYSSFTCPVCRVDPWTTI